MYVNQFQIIKKTLLIWINVIMTCRLQIFPRRNYWRSGCSIIEPAAAERRSHGSVPGDTATQPQGNLSSCLWPTNTYFLLQLSIISYILLMSINNIYHLEIIIDTGYLSTGCALSLSFKGISYLISKVYFVKVNAIMTINRWYEFT